MEFTAANVERVVKEFYSTGGGAPANNDWLNKAQSSMEAWTFAWELLTPGKSAEVQFFGANTIASKVSKCFHEVNQADFPMLRERLVQLFRTYSSGGLKVVLVRLGVALASLMIHSMPHLWQNPVGDQVEQLRKDLAEGGMAMLPGFLELLTVLPEEFATQVMPAQRKGVVRAKLAENLPQVLQLIVQLLQQEASVPKECIRLAARSLQGWVQFGIPVDVTEKLVELILPKVADEELAEDYLDVITSIVSHPETHDHPEEMKRIIARLVVLEQLLAKYMAEENFDSALPLASLLIAIGENHSRLLLDWTVQSEEGKTTATKLVSLILQVSSCPTQYPTNERLSEMAFGFWYIFQDDIIACDPPQFQTCVAVYGQAFHALVEALLKKSMLPLSYDGWSSDEKEAFRCYRTDVADTIMYCYNILKDDLLKLLNHHLDEGIRLCQQQEQQWPYMETCLYAWSAIGASLAEEEENYLVIQFLAKLPSIPCKSDVNVISTTLDCIGGFAEWLDGYPNLVANLVPLVTSSIGNPELALAATMALKDLSRDCTEALQPCSRDIISACGAALSSGRLKPSECARLMFPVGRMVAYLPRGDMLNEMQSILTPYLSELQNIAAKQQAASVADKNQVIYALKIVTTLFQSLDGSGPMTASRQNPNAQQGQQKEPMAILLPQIFPLVANVSRNWLADEEVMDLVYTFMKQTLICLQGTKMLLMETVEYLHSSYTQHPHPCAFDVTSQLFLQYGNDQASR